MNYLRQKFQEKGEWFYEESGGLFVKRRGGYCPTEERFIFIALNTIGLVHAKTQLVVPHALLPEAMDSFCWTVNTYLASPRRGEHVRISFQPSSFSFFLEDEYIPMQRLDRRLDGLASTCDLAFPLCEQVAKAGEWDDQLIQLALCDPERMLRA